MAIIERDAIAAGGGGVALSRGRDASARSLTVPITTELASGVTMAKRNLIWIVLAFLPALALGDNIPERFTIQPDPDFRSLEEKVKSLKKDVIDVSQDLTRLQDELLTPATTKVNIFLSLEGREGFALDSAQFLRDGRPGAGDRDT